MAFVISDLGAGGAQRVLTYVVRWLADSGHQVTVITLAGRSDDFFELDPRVDRVALGLTSRSSGSVEAMRNNMKRVRALRLAIRQISPDTVFAMIGATNVLTVIAAPKRSYVVISERNDPKTQDLGPVWNRLRRIVYPRADIVTANSPAALRELAQYVPQEKLILLPNPVLIPAVIPVDGEREDIILCVGRLHRQKDHATLLRAFSAVRDRFPTWKLVLAGDGPLRRELDRLASELGLISEIEWLGTVEDLGPIYERARIFVLPSRHEGTSNALLEAMAAGLPVVISDKAVGEDVLKETESEIMTFTTGDSVALSAALATLMGDASIRQRIGTRARQAAIARSEDGIQAAWFSALRVSDRA